MTARPSPEPAWLITPLGEQALRQAPTRAPGAPPGQGRRRPYPRLTRQRIEATIERLVDCLDVLDAPGADLEPDCDAEPDSDCEAAL
jgi:hypothetical protein